MISTLQQPPNAEQLMTQNYVAILEKTNQQLSLWYNPYGLMVGILTLVLGLAAIVVSVFLWRNSVEQRKERKKQEEDFYANLTKITNTNVEEARKNVEEARKQYDELITAQEATLKSSKENKKELEKALIELKKERANIGTNIINPLGTATIWKPATSFNSLNTTTSSGIITGATGPLYATTAGYNIDTGATIPLYTTNPRYNLENTIYGNTAPVASLIRSCPNPTCKTSCGYDQKFCSQCGTKLASLETLQ